MFPASRPPTVSANPAQQGVPPGSFAYPQWTGPVPPSQPPPPTPPTTQGALGSPFPTVQPPKAFLEESVAGVGGSQTVLPATASTPRLSETTQLVPTTDSTPSLYLDPTTQSSSLGSSILPQPATAEDSLEQRNSQHGDAKAGASIGSGATAVTGDSVATSTMTRTDPPGMELPGDAMAGGTVAGIVVGVVALLAILAGATTYVVLRKPFLKLLNGQDKSSSENVAYIDDSVRTGYMNTHIELPKENSEEMTSLDNDSFLNSLEAVTIQNYWADNTKNTNV